MRDHFSYFGGVSRVDAEAGGDFFILFAERSAAQTAFQKGKIMCADMGPRLRELCPLRVQARSQLCSHGWHSACCFRPTMFLPARLSDRREKSSLAHIICVPLRVLLSSSMRSAVGEAGQEPVSHTLQLQWALDPTTVAASSSPAPAAAGGGAASAAAATAAAGAGGKEAAAAV